MKSYYPWQASQWASINQRRQQQRLPHALLFSGMAGVGKFGFARFLAQSLLCQQPGIEGEACGQCRSCQQFEAHTHPDYLQVTPAEQGKSITVDQARAVGEYLAVSSHYEGLKVVVIHPAEQMNINAANSLLKTLEEPYADRILILVSNRPSALLPTIRSRCQKVEFANPERQQARDYLQQQLGNDADIDLLLAMSNNAPLTAITLHEQGGIEVRQQLFADFNNIFQGKASSIAVAARWSKNHAPRVLFSQLQSWLMDMLRLKATDQSPWLNNPDLQEALQNLAKGLNWKLINQQLQKVNEANRPGIFSSNLQLWLEDWLIELGNGYRMQRAV
jgi:DNA polymerase-3 subunit delta'